jgi:hypothetical protein
LTPGLHLISIYFILLLPIQTRAQELASLKGTISSENGELLSGVTIQIKNSRLITQTNRDGEYSLSKVPVNSTITFSRLGYKDLSIEMVLIPNQDNIRDIYLITDIQSLDEIHITEKFNNSNSINIDPAKFRIFPQPNGSIESFLKNMPGVSGNNELSSQYSVRGGNFDENLIYLNDVEIFRPLLVRKGQQEGLGFINPDLVSGIHFSAGGFEARYGDKLSSVLDVRYSRPDTFSVDVQAGFLANSVSLKLPLKGSYILAGIRNKRNQSYLSRQYIDGGYHSDFSDYQILYKQNITSKFNFSFFTDYNRGKLKVSPESRITEFGTSDDVLRLFVNYKGDESSNYKSLTSAITFAYNFNKNFNLKWISSYSGNREYENSDLLGWYSFIEKDGGLDPMYTGSLLGRGSNHNYADNYLNTRIYSSELKMYRQLRNSFIEAGFRFQSDKASDMLNEFTAYDTTGYSFPAAGNWMYSEQIRQDNSIGIKRLTGFVQNTFNIIPNLTMAAGLRFNYNTYSGENLISPRFSLIYYPSDKDELLFRFSAGSYIQAPFYRELKNYNGVLNADARAQKSYQFIAGTDYKFNGLGTRLKFSSEIYYKILSRITPYKIEDLKVRYISDKYATGYAAGADFNLSGNFAGDLESTFRLSLMKTEEDIKNDFYYVKNLSGLPVIVYPGKLRRPTDQLFNIGMMFQDKFPENPTYKVHLNLIYSSSLPVGIPGPDRYTDEFKIPAYKRVDIGFSKDLVSDESKKTSVFLKKHFSMLSLHAELFNLLNFKNTGSYLWLNDKKDNQYAVPNYLTFRKFNFRVIAKIKSR